jgi:drug/metabolite transporter (DMT)-like permease
VTASDDGLPWPLGAIAARPRVAALLGAMCIAFSGILYRWAEVSPSTGTVFRALFGLPLLGFVAWLEYRRFGRLPARTVRLAALAGVFFAGDLLFWHHAIEAVGAGLATVLGNLQVLVVGVVAWLAFGERPSRSTFVALPVVLAGVALISGAIGGGAYGANPGLGVVLGVATALCYGGYLLLIRRGGRDLRRPAGPVAIATVSTAVVAALVGTVVGDLDPTPAIASLAWLALLGLTSQSLGYLLISLSLPRLPAVLTSMILLSQPVMTVGLSVVLLGEAPSPAQLIGVALVIGGIAIATLGGSGARITTRLRPSAAG